MSNLWVVFYILDTEWNPQPEWFKASGHIIFVVRMTLEQKAWWMKYDHITPEPENLTYAGVVSQESVKIDLTYAALNGLDVCACGMQNTYLQIPSFDKHFIICGP